MCNDELGNIISEDQGILARWVQHFDTLLNQINSGVIESESHEDLQEGEDEEDEPPTPGEIMTALEKLKGNKSPGPDNLQAELLKYGGTELVNCLSIIFKNIWARETVSQEWKTGIICPILKTVM